MSDSERVLGYRDQSGPVAFHIPVGIGATRANMYLEQLNKNKHDFFNFAESKEKRNRGKPGRQEPCVWSRA